MSTNDILRIGGRPRIADKWGVPPPATPRPVVHRLPSADGSERGQEVPAEPRRHTSGGVSRRSRIICTSAGALSLAVSVPSAGFLSDGFARSYNPPPAIVLIALSLVWAMLEIMPLYAMVRRNADLYTKWTKGMLLAGPSLMALGRFGLGLTAIRATAVVLLPTVFVLPALGHLFADERTAPGRRLFFYLLSLGLTTQFACAPSDGIAQVRAIGIAVALFGFLAPIQPKRLLSLLDTADPRRLATALWWISGLTLAANAAAKAVTGSSTPGLTICGVGLAPYWLIAFPVLTSVGIELREGNWKRLTVGLGSMIAEYLLLLHEGGTALLVLVGALMVTMVLGSSMQILGALMGGTASYMFLKTGLAASAAGIFSERIASRLSIWHGTAFNAQIASYLDVVSMSGLIGFCGAARTSFLISAASKDFVLGAVAANAGLTGLATVTVGVACYLVEIGRSVASQTSAFRRAAGCGVLLALCASVVISYVPVTGWLVPTGLPLPALSRGAAVTVAACGALILVEWLSGKDISI